MALKTPYLAAENSAMERRSRALHRFLVGSPIALLIAVGLVAHLRKPPYAYPASGAKYDAQVLAYRDRVVAVQDMRSEGVRASDERILAEARKWVAGYVSGALVAIPPAFYEDRMREGVRGEIVRAGMSIATEAALLADRSLLEGKVDRAMESALLAAQTARGVRNFETQAHLQSLLLVRRSLGIVLRGWPSVSEADKAELRPRIELLYADLAEVDRLAELDRVQTEDYVRRQKITSPPAFGDPRFLDLTEEEQGAARRSVEMNNERIKTLMGPGWKPSRA